MKYFFFIFKIFYFKLFENVKPFSCFSKAFM